MFKSIVQHFHTLAFSMGKMTDFKKLYYDGRKYPLFLKNILTFAENKSLVEKISISI